MKIRSVGKIGSTRKGVSPNQSRLIKQGIKLQNEAQRLFNEEKYEDAMATKKEANRILDGFDEAVVNEHFKKENVADLKKAPEGWIQRPNRDEWQFWRKEFIRKRMSIEKDKSGGYRIYIMDEGSGGITKSEPIATKAEARSRANKYKRIISSWKEIYR